MLNHPDIEVVHEWDTDDDEAYLIMEHVDGCSLAELLDAYAPLDLDEAAAVLGPVADAVEYAPEAEKKIKAFTLNGFDKLPICMAKTHLSFTPDPNIKGAPSGFEVPVREVRASASAGGP